jgi:hypothetical protein
VLYAGSLSRIGHGALQGCTALPRIDCRNRA